MTRLFLIRHGQTDWNLQHRWQGQCDVPLNAEGIRQAEALARAFRTVAVDRVFSSDLSRARDTAALVSRATGAPHTVLASLRERSFGGWEGLTNEEILRGSADEMAEYQRNRDAFVPPGGQSWIEFGPTAVEAVEAIAAEHPDQRLAIVAHGGVLKAFVNHVLGIDRGPFNQFVLENGSISVVVKREHEITRRIWWQITALNATCHLDGKGRFPG